MNSRPAAFTLISLMLTTLLLSCAAYLLTSDFNFSNPKDLQLLVLMLSSGVLLGIAAFGTWRPRPWGYLALSCSVGIVAALDITALWSTGKFTIFYLPDLVLMGSAILILWEPTTREIFFDASKRWWENARRIALGLPTLARSSRSDDNINIVNISESGCLITSDKTYKIGERIELRIADGFWLYAKIVRKTDSQYGAKFDFNSWYERKQLKGFVSSAQKSVPVQEPAVTKRAA